MRAITIRQPWAWAIIHAGKDIENRDWRPYQDYCGPLLIHAGLSKDDLYSGARWIDVNTQTQVPSLETLRLGAIIGVVDLVDCHTNNRRQQRGTWGQAASHYHWELKNPGPLAQPVPCNGKHKLWIPSAEIVQAVSDQLSLIALT